MKRRGKSSPAQWQLCANICDFISQTNSVNPIRSNADVRRNTANINISYLIIAKRAPFFRMKRQRTVGQPAVKIDDCSRQNSAYGLTAVFYFY